MLTFHRKKTRETHFHLIDFKNVHFAVINLFCNNCYLIYRSTLYIDKIKAYRIKVYVYKQEKREHIMKKVHFIINLEEIECINMADGQAGNMVDGKTGNMADGQVDTMVDGKVDTMADGQAGSTVDGQVDIMVAEDVNYH